MSILELSTLSDVRLVEVQKLLAHIKSLESAAADGDAVSGQAASMLRGLFYVSLYGALEYAVSLSVQILLQEITKVEVPYSHFEHLMHTIALDAEFQSLVDSGWTSKFPRRKQLLDKQVSADPCRLNDTVFHDQLQNLWFKTLKLVFEHLGITKTAVPEPRMQGYVDEIVNYRNEVAHGRSSASAVGRLISSSDLDQRLKAVREIIDYVMIVFDDYLANWEFVASAHRPLYQALPTQASS